MLRALRQSNWLEFVWNVIHWWGWVRTWVMLWLDRRCRNHSSDGFSRWFLIKYCYILCAITHHTSTRYNQTQNLFHLYVGHWIFVLSSNWCLKMNLESGLWYASWEIIYKIISICSAARFFPSRKQRKAKSHAWDRAIRLSHGQEANQNILPLAEENVYYIIKQNTPVYFWPHRGGKVIQTYHLEVPVYRLLLA